MFADQMRAGIGSTNLSLPAQMQRAAAKQQKLNLCPCGCADVDLNEHGYCKHLIGFTNDFNHETGAPKVGGKIELREFSPDPRWSIEERVGVQTDKLKADDILVPITTTARVYRGVRVIKPSPLSDMAVMQQQMEALQKEVKELRAAKPPKSHRKKLEKKPEPELQPA